MASSARIDELLKKFGENPRRYFAPLANEYRKAGDVDRAIQLCSEHLPQQPGHMSGHIVFGQALFEARRFDEARQVFESALAFDPENLIALRHLGDIARDAHDVAGARDWYRRVLDADPRNEEIAAQITALDAPALHAPATDAAVAVELAPTATSLVETVDPVDDAVALDAPEIPAEEPLPAVPSPVEYSSDDTGIIGEFITLDAGPAAADAETPPRGVATVAAPRAEVDDAPFDLDLSGLDVGPSATEPLAVAPLVPSAPGAPASGARADDLPPGDTLELLDAIDSGSVLPLDVPAEAARAAGGPARAGRDDLVEMMATADASDDADDPLLGDTASESEPAAAPPPAFVTETMAELYLQQGFRDEALSVYRQILTHQPGDERLRKRVAQLESASRSGASEAGSSEWVVEHTVVAAPAEPRADEPAGPAAPSVREFFAALGARRPAHGRVVPVNGPGADTGPAAAALDYDEFGFPSLSAASAPGRDREVPSRTGADGAAAIPMDVQLAEAIESATLDDLADHLGADTPAAGLAAPDDVQWIVAPSSDDRPVGEPPAPTPAEGPVDSLFVGAPVRSQDDAAAAALAGAFSRGVTDLPRTGEQGTVMPAPAGRQSGVPRATRPARGELSLDHVFRDTPRRASGQRRPTPGFSFDQFFAESTDSRNEDGAEPAVPGSAAGAPPAAREDESSATDIEQFTAWLEGLKKK